METTNYADIVLPPDLEWYDELGGQSTGWVCEADGPGWWHVSEIDLSTPAPHQPERPSETL